MALAIALAAYCFWPRHADLRSFMPSEVAHLETAMWRHYYHREYLSLFGSLYWLYRREYHFSPADSTRLACLAARAATRFQPTHSRAEAQKALPLLETYYHLIRQRTAERFDPQRAAALELDWWQFRREGSTPAQYGEIIARSAREIYRVDNADLTEAALLRAQMMNYRDERSRGHMSPEDWSYIEKGLVHSYQLLKQSLADGARNTW